VCACVELDPSASLGPEDIRRASRSLLAPFQVPKYVLVVAELPRNANGKVRKPELRTHAAETLSPGGRADR
jgi:fatty-acyl-CoA synthase